MAKQKRATSDPIEIQTDTDKLVRFLSMYCDAHHRQRQRKPFKFDHPNVSAKILEGPELCDECVPNQGAATVLSTVTALFTGSRWKR